MVAAGTAGPVAPRQISAGTNFDISDGSFTNEALIPPPTLAELRAKAVMNYALSVDGAPSGSVGEGGLAVAVPAGGSATVSAHAQVAATDAVSSQIMWMQNLAITGDQVAPGSQSTIDLSAVGAKPHGAQVGVEHVNLSLTSTGAVHAVVHVLAQANAGAGFGGVVDLGDVHVVAHGDDAYASTTLETFPTYGGSVWVNVDGDVSDSATGRLTHSYTQLWARGMDGGYASVHVGGNVVLASQASETAVVQAVLHSSGDLSVAGDVNVSAQGVAETIQVQLASDFFSSANVHGVNVDTGTGAAHVWLDIWSQPDPSISDMGSVALSHLSMHVNGSSDAVINIQQSNDATTGVVGNGFIAHGSGAGGNLSLGDATFTGTGAVHLNFAGRIDTVGTTTQGTVQSFHAIDQGDLSLLDMHLQLQDQASSLSTVAMTTIKGFSGAHDAVVFNNEPATAQNFASLGSFTTIAAMDTAMETALDSTHTYVFAVYNGTEDLNRNGLQDDQGAGVLAYDHDGNGMTAALMLPNVTALTPTDLA